MKEFHDLPLDGLRDNQRGLPIHVARFKARHGGA